MGGTINFVNQSGSLVSNTVASQFTSFPHPTTGQTGDLGLGTFTSAFSSSDEVAFYPIVDFQFEAQYPGQPLLNYGRPDAGSSPVVGTNNIDAVGSLDLYDSSGNLSSDGILDTRAFSFSQGPQTGETFAQSGDSGSPSFIPFDDQLGLVGLHSAIASASPTTFDIFLEPYIAQLNEQMSDEGFSVTTIPEPSSALLILLTLFVFNMRRYR